MLWLKKACALRSDAYDAIGKELVWHAGVCTCAVPLMPAHMCGPARAARNKTVLEHHDWGHPKL